MASRPVWLDHARKMIIMSRTFAKKAEDPRSNEYAILKQLREDNFGYAVIRKEIRKNPHSEHYKGLTYDYMRTYITNHEPEATRQTMSDELEHMIEISKCHSIRYATIKKWFLAKYPDVAGFGNEVESRSEEDNQNNVTPLPQPVAQEEVEYDNAGNF